VPEVRPHPMSTLHFHDPNCQSLAISYLGNGYPWPLPQSYGQSKYLFVVMDYFTKWIEVEAVASITTAEVRRFIWRNIMIRFGIPRAIILITTHSSILIGSPTILVIWAAKLGSLLLLTLRPMAKPRRPTSLFSMACRRNLTMLKETGWTNCTTSYGLSTRPRVANGETPFMIAYRSKAILPVEVTLRTHRLTIQEELNNAALREALYLFPSIRSEALLREAIYKLRIARLYDHSSIAAHLGKQPCSLSYESCSSHTRTW